MYRNGIQGYRRTNVITADRKRLVLMCYEGAIESLSIGKQYFAEKDYERKAVAITKAKDIINELQCSLDFERGGVIAQNLDSLYNYILRRILYADINKDFDAIDEVIGMLNELRSAWEEVFYKRGGEITDDAVAFEQEKRLLSNYVSA